MSARRSASYASGGGSGPVTLGGDVTGPSGSNTVSLLQTVPLNLTGITSGDFLQFNGTSIVPVVPPSGGLGPFGEFVYVDVLLGNDSTGARGNDNLPFATLNAALAVYQNGDVIQLGAGDFLGTVDLDLATLATAVVIRGIKGTTRIYQNTPASTMTSTLKNLIALFDVTVDNSNGYAIDFTGATNPDILLSGVSVQLQGGLGVRVDDANRLDIRSGSRIEDPLVISNTLQPFHATSLSEGSTLDVVSITSTINSNIVLQSGSSILNTLTTNGTSINVFEGCFVENITAFLSNNSVSMGGRIGSTLDLTCDTNGTFNPVILTGICSATNVAATGPGRQTIDCFGAGFSSYSVSTDFVDTVFRKSLTLATPTFATGSTAYYDEVGPGNTVYVDVALGSDTLGRTDRADMPFRTVASAFSAVSALPNIPGVYSTKLSGFFVEDVTVTPAVNSMEICGTGTNIRPFDGEGTIVAPASPNQPAVVSNACSLRLRDICLMDSSGGVTPCLTFDGASNVYSIELVDCQLLNNFGSDAASIVRADFVRIHNVQIDGNLTIQDCNSSAWEGVAWGGGSLISRFVTVLAQNTAGSHVFYTGGYGPTQFIGSPEVRAYGGDFLSMTATLDGLVATPQMRVHSNILGSVIITASDNSIIDFSGSTIIDSVILSTTGGNQLIHDFSRCRIDNAILVGDNTTINLSGASYDEKLVNLSTATSRIIRGPEGRLASYQDTNSGLFIQAVPIYTTPYDAVFTLKATVNAYAVSAALSGSFIIEARYRIVGGAMSIIGTPTSSYDGDVVPWICIATTNGVNIEISTVGDGVNTVQFEMHTQIFENEFI
jgi:hypothetical protein